MSAIAKTPPPPYYAVIFTSVRTEGDGGFKQAAGEMEALGYSQPGFLGAESVRDISGVGIRISYWESLQAIENWKNNTKHQDAQKMGQDIWYSSFATRVCKVEKLGMFK